MAGRAIRSVTVVLVVLTALVCGLAPSALWIRTTYGELRSHYDAAHPLLLEWNATRVRARIEAAQGEIARIARHLPGAATPDPLVAALTQAVEASETYSGLLVVDSRGQLVSAVGAGPAVESLVATLQSTMALESQLVDVMRSAQLRKRPWPSTHVVSKGGCSGCARCSSSLRPTSRRTSRWARPS